ncbi:unnamed protein product [Diamesa hyperborea]
MEDKKSGENKDLDKYIKFLVFKTSQIIVQSRLGGLVQTKCNKAGTDWFNIAIQDHPDVSAETKKALQISQYETITERLPLCVEISLQTVEGDKMILEVWSLNLDTEICDPIIKPTYNIYNRMGLLLKSLISVTRVTPAYKLSRRQTADSYSIYYRIYVGDPQIHNLGDSCNIVRIGHQTLHIGTLTMAVAYRTKMTISPTQTGRDNTIMLKSDHFLKDLSPKHMRYVNYNKKNEKKVIDLDKPMRCGAFVDTSRIKQYTEDDFILPETPPFNWLLRKTKEEIPEINKTDDEKLTSSENDENLTPTNLTTNNDINTNNTNNLTCRGSNSKLSQSPKTDVSGTSPSSLKSVSRWSLKGDSNEEDLLLKELKFPFATNSPIGDLARFYRECFNAPPLQGFNEPIFDEVECEETDDELTKQLEQFETSLGDFDSMLTSLCDSNNETLNS